MKTKNILLGMVAVALSAVLTGCYEKFDPAPEQKIYDDAWFEENGYSYASIEEVKQLFTDNVGDPANAATYAMGYRIIEPYYIKGKVISNDTFGNVYNSLYIQDETGAIEIKVGLSGLYSKYVVGETVYVVCQDLILGNYRRNLSLGGPTSDPNYANSNIGVKYLIDVHLKQGERTTMSSADTLVINSDNIAQYVGADQTFKPSINSRLVRLEGSLSTWGTFSGNTYPSFLESVDDPATGTTVYTEITYTSLFAQWDAYDAAIATGQSATLPATPRPANFYYDDRVPTWAYQEYKGPARYYGSSRFTVSAIPIIVRVSGYSKFALESVPVDGRVVTMTGIINLYTSRTGGFPANQLLLNSGSDVY